MHIETEPDACKMQVALNLNPFEKQQSHIHNFNWRYLNNDDQQEKKSWKRGREYFFLPISGLDLAVC